MARRFLQAADDGTDNADAVPAASTYALHWHLHGSAATKAAIAGNVVVVLIFFAVVIWRIFFTGTTLTTIAQEGAAITSSSSASSSSSSSSSTLPCITPRSGGLGKADLLALPMYVHGGAEGPAVECAVCLGELRDGETGRMLPRCGHRFHAECVDRWFRLHVTCPLCRAAVVDGGSGKSPKVQLRV